MIGASAAIRGGSSATDAIAKNVMKENPNKAAEPAGARHRFDVRRKPMGSF